MRFTIKTIRTGFYQHPATHATSRTDGDLTALPYGARLRLRHDFDLSQLPSDQARVVARALQKYGMFMADGGNLYISATDNAQDAVGTSSLNKLKATDFEWVDGGPKLKWSDYECNRTVVTN
jgi:serine/threonine-protein kinase